MQSVAVRWLLILLTWSQCSGRWVAKPGALEAALHRPRSHREAGAADPPCLSAVCRWEAFRAATLPGETRRWPAGASLALAQLRLTAGPDSQRLARHCRRLQLGCVHPLCPCGPRRTAARGDTPSHDDMCDMLCGIGEGGSECECMRPPAAVGPLPAR
ncbi:uncharacterized protein LOC122373806 [Amphibalanus amphitrite]|uniref:uncharacterized protein LOC122373806 n=1 Tax=Amphibalanus amphitrite TaxID=1232801 RepID=UPI001C90592D|nr:uncharacterized protein LOC122373806 [Amphibalanus amphitrite]